MVRGDRRGQAYLVEPNFPAVPFAELLAPARFVSEGIIAAVGAILGVAAWLGAKIERRLAAARTIGELQVLSDHTLRDIGLLRGGIPHAVREIERGLDPRRR